MSDSASAPLLRDLGSLKRQSVVVLTVVMAAAVVAHGAYAIFGLGKGSADVLISDGLSSVAYVGAAALCLSRAALIRSERAPWAVLGAGSLSYAVGQLYYVLVLKQLPEAEVPFPSLADGFWLLLFPAIYVALMLLIRARIPRFYPSMWLDGLLGAFGVAALAAALVFSPILEASTGDFGAVATNLAYPAGDFILIALVVGIFGLTGLR